MEERIYNYVRTMFMENTIYTFPMKVKDLLQIYYVAVRGQSDEPGAVQRVLNKRRIAEIKNFILDGNTFVNSFIINWTSTEYEPQVEDSIITLTLHERTAQILDGQHRLAGLQEAVLEKESVGETEVLVSMFMNLDTKSAAAIFLNINSKQKPVPSSLIYDLFGEAVDNRELATNRANDIIEYLNTSTDSPYFGLVKYPGMARHKSGMIDISSMINAMKPHLEKDGEFAQYFIDDLNTMTKIITNFYNTIKKANPLLWEKSNNPFLKAAGFGGAFDFLCAKLLQQCVNDKKFSMSHMVELMKLEGFDFAAIQEKKVFDGRNAKKIVFSQFNECFNKDIAISPLEYEF